MPTTNETRPRADRGVRILSAPTADAVGYELSRVGCGEEGVRIMLPKGQFFLVKLSQVRAEAANIVKQELLSHGGDAAVHWKTVACGVPETDIVLMATEAQLRQVCSHLHRQPYYLAGTADAILHALRAYTESRNALRCGPYKLPLGEKTYIMGIINTSPDSFSGDSVFGDPERALQIGEQMLKDGADIIDVGGESSRPGADAISVEEELHRVIPVVRALTTLGVPISVDTYKSAVACEAIDAGATLINDITGLQFDEAMADTVAVAHLPVVVMHMKGTPKTMQQAPKYQDMMGEIAEYLNASTRIAVAAGIPQDQVIIDPGFGFGKSVAHNLELLRRLREFTSSGQAILLGTSRKSTIGAVLGNLPPEERMEGTAATVALAIMNGADIIRVHDVKAMMRVAKMTDSVVRNSEFLIET